MNTTVTCLIIFFKGGTSTDVSRYAGIYEQVYETITAGNRLSQVLCIDSNGAI